MARYAIERFYGYAGPLTVDVVSHFMANLWEQHGKAAPDALLMSVPTCTSLSAKEAPTNIIGALGDTSKFSRMMIARITNKMTGDTARVVYDHDLPYGTVIASTPLDRVVCALVPEAA